MTAEVIGDAVCVTHLGNNTMFTLMDYARSPNVSCATCENLRDMSYIREGACRCRILVEYPRTFKRITADCELLTLEDVRKTASCNVCEHYRRNPALGTIIKKGFTILR